MDLSRRTLLKGGAGLSSLAVPFYVGRHVGRREVQPGSEAVARAASRTHVRLTSGVPAVAESRDDGAAGRRSGSRCDVDFERQSVASGDVDAALRSLDRERSFDWERYPLDDTIRTTDAATVETLLRCDRTDWNDYTDDFYDCEEFAMSLRMNLIESWSLNNVGIVYDESASPVPHVYNLVLYGDGSFDLVEPQADRVVSPGEDERYSFRDVTILL